MEVARAGDIGKGFTVAAVEMRRLAQPTASALADVKVLIEQSANEVRADSRLAADAAERLNGILEGVRASSMLMDGISSDSQEQSTGNQRSQRHGASDGRDDPAQRGTDGR
ncbi:MAG: methyl-accepting chemotaxis protein [Candidatus Devosia symbiotica]|nr:methyl-accepting chemotaxis protein [Candidatus Devosia symbiotica]